MEKERLQDTWAQWHNLKAQLQTIPNFKDVFKLHANTNVTDVRRAFDDWRTQPALAISPEAQIIEIPANTLVYIQEKGGIFRVMSACRVVAEEESKTHNGYRGISFKDSDGSIINGSIKTEGQVERSAEQG